MNSISSMTEVTEIDNFENWLKGAPAVHLIKNGLTEFTFTFGSFQEWVIYTCSRQILSFCETITPNIGKHLCSVLVENLTDINILKENSWKTIDLHGAFEIAERAMPLPIVSDQMPLKGTEISIYGALAVNAISNQSKQTSEDEQETNTCIKTNVVNDEKPVQYCYCFEHRRNNLQSNVDAASPAAIDRIKEEARTELSCAYNDQTTTKKATAKAQHDNSEKENGKSVEKGIGQTFKMDHRFRPHQDIETTADESFDAINCIIEDVDNSDLFKGDFRSFDSEIQNDHVKHSERYKDIQNVLLKVHELVETVLDLKAEVLKLNMNLEQKDKIPLVTNSDDTFERRMGCDNINNRLSSNENTTSHGNVLHQTRNGSTQVCSTDFNTGTRSSKIELIDRCEENTGLKTVQNTVGRNTTVSTGSRVRCTIIDPSIPSRERLFSSETIFGDDEEPEQTMDCLKLPDPTLCLRNETDAKSLISLQEKCSKTQAGNSDNDFRIPEQTLSSGYPMSSASSKEFMTSARSNLFELFEQVSFEKSDFRGDLELPLSVTATDSLVNEADDGSNVNSSVENPSERQNRSGEIQELEDRVFSDNDIKQNPLSSEAINVHLKESSENFENENPSFASNENSPNQDMPEYLDHILNESKENCNDENSDIADMDNESSVSPTSFHQVSTCCGSIHVDPETKSALPRFLKSCKVEEIEEDTSDKKPTSNLLQVEDDYVIFNQYEATSEYQKPDKNTSHITILQSNKPAEEEKTVNKFDVPCQLIRLEGKTLNFVPTRGKNEKLLGCLFKQSDSVFHNIHVEVLLVGNDGILRQVDPLAELFASQDFCAEKERSFSETVCELNDESVYCNSIESEVPNGENEPDFSITDNGVKENAISESNISQSNKDGIEDINKDSIIDLNNIPNHCSPTERKSIKNHMKKKRKKQIRKSYNERIFPAPESTSLSSLNHSTKSSVSAERATFFKSRRLSKQSTFFSSSYTREKKSCCAAVNSAIYDSGFGSRTRSLESYKSEILNEISRETFSFSKVNAGRYCEAFEHKHSVHCSKQQQSKTGVKIKVCASELRSMCKTYGKQIRRFFKDKGVPTLESLVRELHIEHRSLKVFGLGSYFDRLNRGESMSVRERMHYEWLRLASFQHYAGNGNALSLARNGFYHDPTDGPTSTRCYLCEARHSTWEYFDNIEAEHRRQSPDCPFHSNQSEESTNVSISYETPQSRRAPPTSTPSVHSTVLSSGTASSGSASLSQTQTTTCSQNIYQPQENDDNRQHSLLALPNSQSYRALGRSGETTYSHLTTPPRRNNIVPGASSINASVDGFASSVPTSTATNMVSSNVPTSTATNTVSSSIPTNTAKNMVSSSVPTSTVTNTVSSSVPTSTATNTVSSSVPTSIATSTSSVLFHQSTIPSRPINAGAFGGFNAPTLSSVSTSSSTTSTSTSQSISAPAVAAAASSLLRPSQTPIGGGGRTDPTITVVVDNAKHPDYRELDARINSYQGWPDYLDQTARQMAEAGFFFVGVADFTRCFCCGGGLRNWEPGDDPMLEHTRWFPRCEYVNKLKGERYVAAVQRRHQQHMEEQQRQQQELARSRDANRNPPDPMSTEAAAVLREMGYQQEKIKDAILTVRRQIGVPDVTTQQVLAWLLDQHEARSLPTSSRSSPTTDLGVKVKTGLASSSIQTSTQSSVINSTPTISTATSTAVAGSSSSVVSSASASTGAGSQQSGSSTSTTSSSGSTEAESKPTSQTGSKANGAKEGKSMGKQSAASGGESDEEFKSAEETLSSDTKPAKKKTRKKNKPKSGAKPSGAPSGLNDVDTQALKEENEKLREMQTCKICMERLVNTTLLPCGHLVCCDVCAARLNRCPICRKRIKGTVKTFMS